MFDLNEAIKQWRKDLELGETMAKPDLDELESHLRDQMEELRTTGLSHEEAFWVGTHRLGDAGAIQREYTKVNGSARWKNRLFWMAVGLFGYFMLRTLSLAAGDLTVSTAFYFGFRGWEYGIADSIARAFFLGITLYSIYLICNRGWIESVFRFFFQGSRRRVILRVSLAILFALLISLLPFFVTPIKNRFLSPSDYGKLEFFRFCTGTICSILFPLIFITFIYKFTWLDRQPSISPTEIKHCSNEP